MALSYAVLAALDVPRTLAELAHALAVEPGRLRSELARLEGRGHVLRLPCAGQTGNANGTDARLAVAAAAGLRTAPAARLAPAPAVAACRWCAWRAGCEPAVRERWSRAPS
jgi:hypothetical protein